MGADLITYITVGPNKIKDATSIQKAKDHVKKFYESAVSAATQKEPWFDGQSGSFETADDFLNMFNWPNTEPESLVDDLVDLWNNPDCRDVNWRFIGTGDSTKKILVAGDSTWGDTPDGEGYNILFFADVCGIFDILGLE